MSQNYPEFLALMITYLDKIKNKDGDVSLTSISENNMDIPTKKTTSPLPLTPTKKTISPLPTTLPLPPIPTKKTTLPLPPIPTKKTTLPLPPIPTKKTTLPLPPTLAEKYEYLIDYIHELQYTYKFWIQELTINPNADISILDKFIVDSELIDIMNKNIDDDHIEAKKYFPNKQIIIKEIDRVAKKHLNEDENNKKKPPIESPRKSELNLSNDEIQEICKIAYNYPSFGKVNIGSELQKINNDDFIFFYNSELRNNIFKNRSDKEKKYIEDNIDELKKLMLQCMERQETDDEKRKELCKQFENVNIYIPKNLQYIYDKLKQEEKQLFKNDKNNLKMYIIDTCKIRKNDDVVIHKGIVSHDELFKKAHEKFKVKKTEVGEGANEEFEEMGGGGQNYKYKYEKYKAKYMAELKKQKKF
jgi:hypothetical protein